MEQLQNNPLATLIDLSGKTALVTGGAMGIGRGIARRLSEAGANIVLADMNDSAGKKAAQELGENSLFVRTDVSVEADVKTAVATAADAFGGIDILVNNAGIYPLVPLMEMDQAMFDKILAVNLRGIFLCTKAVAEVMIAQGRGGKIINITSIDALHPSSVGLAAYDASKHGAWGFTKNSALELAPHRIQVNAIAPGGIRTPGTGADGSPTPEMEEVQRGFLEKIPMKRMGESDDIGRVALFLASDLASYMTGSQIVVDGGVLLS